MTAPMLGRRACSFLVGVFPDGSEDVCGKPPVRHIAWRDTAEGVEPGWACQAHVWDAEAFDCVGHHPVGACCGMPGARWVRAENVCRVDDDGLPVAEPVRSVADGRLVASR